MGRELRRKEERKNKKTIEKEEELDTSIKGTTALKIAFTVILVLLVIYYILAVFVTKEVDVSSKEETTKDNSQISASISNKIVATNIFNQSEEKYYVYCYDFANEDEGVKSAIESVSDITIYKMDTSNSLNSKYVTEGQGNKDATTLENLKVTNPTLLVIEGDSIKGYYEGRTSIMAFLGG